MIHAFTMLDDQGVRHVAIMFVSYVTPPSSACGAKLHGGDKDIHDQPITCIRCLAIQQSRK